MSERYAYMMVEDGSFVRQLIEDPRQSVWPVFDRRLSKMTWQGYRRPRGSQARWQKVTDADGRTKAEAYQRLMDLCELRGGADHREWDYMIMEGDERPKNQDYETRVMKPKISP